MAAITIRQLEDSTKTRLRMRAASNGRSMEAEAREILRQALTDKEGGGQGLAHSIQRLFAPLGGIELVLPKRESIKTPPDFREQPKRGRAGRIKQGQPG